MAKSRTTQANMITAKPGDIRNPSGKKAPFSIAAAIKRRGNLKKADNIADALIRKAEEGQLPAIKLIGDFQHEIGFPSQVLNVGIENNTLNISDSVIQDAKALVNANKELPVIDVQSDVVLTKPEEYIIYTPPIANEVEVVADNSLSASIIPPLVEEVNKTYLPGRVFSSPPAARFI